MSRRRGRVELRLRLPVELAQAVARASRDAKSVEEAVRRLLGRALRRSERPGSVLRTAVVAALLHEGATRRSMSLVRLRERLATAPRRTLDKALEELEAEGVLRLLRPRSLRLEPRERAAALFDPTRGHLTRIKLEPLPRAVRAALVLAATSDAETRSLRTAAS